MYEKSLSFLGSDCCVRFLTVKSRKARIHFHYTTVWPVMSGCDSLKNADVINIVKGGYRLGVRHGMSGGGKLLS